VRPRGGAGQGGAGGAHRGRRSTARRRKRLRVAVFNSGGGAPRVGGDEGVALQLRGGREE
jgi:hypothetical protein